MLASAARLRHAADFRRVLRQGRRAATPRMVAHLLQDPDPHHPQVGFAVGRAVGPAVVRNRVRRQLRHVMRDRVTGLPPGTVLVVRALAPAAGETAASLGDDLDATLRRLLRRPAAAGQAQ